jgi:hypothetical protein
MAINDPSKCFSTVKMYHIDIHEAYIMRKKVQFDNPVETIKLESESAFDDWFKKLQLDTCNYSAKQGYIP